jgi:hypothetical protein
MRAFLNALWMLPVAVVVVLLAVANRDPVTVSLDPFSRGGPLISYSVPLWALLFGAVAFGVIVGGCGAWLAQGRNRRERRQARREANHLRAEADRLRARMEAGSGLPALPSSAMRR